MKRINYSILAITLIIFSACNNDDEAPQIPASEGAILEVSVGGPTQPNQVYIDLSTDQQSVVNKSTWDLGFYNGTDFAVILNAASEVMAREIPKSDLSQIEESDYEGFSEQTTVDGIFSNLFNPPPYPEWLSESKNWIDSPDGNLSKTAINNIGAESTIYYVNRGLTPGGEFRGEMLLKVTKNTNSYTVEYVTPGDTNVTSIEVQKSEKFNFTYLNFDDGIVAVTPENDFWDIAFTTYMEKLDVGGGLFIPYRFQDYVIQNRNNVKIATVLLNEGDDLLDAYETFSRPDVPNVDFSQDLNSIGSNWRTVASPTPGSVTGVREDRFYIISDPTGNFYKLLFTQMLSKEGERGFPQITYEIIK